MKAPPSGTRLEVEQWLVTRGVPQLVEGYRDEQRMDSTATPFIAVWLVLGTVAWWATRPDWTLAMNALSAAVAILGMAIAYAVYARARGRHPRQLPRTWDVRDILVFGLLPGVVAGIVHGPLQGAFAFGNALLGVGAIYLVVAFGIIDIARWALRRVVTEVEHLVELIARTLPLLLILVIFLLFSAELWEAAHEMEVGEFALFLGLIGLVGLLLIVTNVRSEVLRIAESDDWAGMLDAVRATPAEALVAGLPPDRPSVPRLTRLQRANLSLLILVSQLVQSVFVGVLVAAFLVAVGLIAIPVTVQERWIGEPIRAAALVNGPVGTFLLSSELLVVSGMLGAIVGLYFTGLSLTDAAFRRDYFARVIAEVERIAAVRAVYVVAIRTPDVEPVADPG